MKKISLFLLLTFIGYYVVSCSEKTVDPNNELANIEKIETFKKLSKSEMKVAYSSLSKYDKYFFWKQRTLEYLSANKLSEQQASLIEELLKQASPEIFIVNSKANSDFKKFITKWQVQAQSIFPSSQDRVFATIGDKNLSGARVYVVTCDCARSSVFISDCPDDQSCLIPPSPGCQATQDQEDEGGAGCGFWWLDTCNMKCRE